MNYPNQNPGSYNPGPPRGPYSSSASPFTASTMTSVAQSSSDVQLEFIRKTYSLFLAGILCSLVMGSVTLHVQSLYMASVNLWMASPILFLLVLYGSSIGAQAVSRTEGLNYVGLFGFTGIMGFLFAPVLSLYERSFPGIVSQAAIMSALTFGALTAYALITRKDFSFLGGLLFVGSISLVASGILNVLFFHSWGFSYWFAWGSLLISSGFVLYKTSDMLTRFDPRGYCSAALSLYISFFNIFMAILRILSNGRRN